MTNVLYYRICREFIKKYFLCIMKCYFTGWKGNVSEDWICICLHFGFCFYFYSNKKDREKEIVFEDVWDCFYIIFKKYFYLLKAFAYVMNVKFWYNCTYITLKSTIILNTKEILYVQVQIMKKFHENTFKILWQNFAV